MFEEGKIGKAAEFLRILTLILLLGRREFDWVFKVSLLEGRGLSNKVFICKAVELSYF